MRRISISLAFAFFLLIPTSVAAAECQFVLGFATLRDLIGHNIVGECLENEHHNEIGDSVQQTTGGLLVWRKADNWTAFTDGYRTWINGRTASCSGSTPNALNGKPITPQAAAWLRLRLIFRLRLHSAKTRRQVQIHSSWSSRQ